MYDVIVIGGGAAGLMAAGTAARLGHKVLLLEKMEKAGRKVRITGKGRCNLTNMRPHEEFLEMVRTHADFFRPAFKAFDNRSTVEFFTRLGVALATERGERVFPCSGRAWDVADALVGWCVRGGVTVEYDARVTDIRTEKGRVCAVEYAEHDSMAAYSGRRRRKNEPKRPEIRTESCRNVILCTGGVSYPATGSTGDGYTLADRLGHRIEPVRPSLVPLESDLPQIRTLRGLQLKNITAHLSVDGRRVASEFGEMEFTDRGVGGAIVLRLSRDAVDALIEEHRVELVLDLKPALSETKLDARIDRERELFADKDGARLEDLLRKLIPRSLVPHLARKMGLQPRMTLKSVSPDRLHSLTDILKNFVIPVSDYRPFEEAIVTAGGIDVSQIDPTTLQSKLIGGLYFAGEVLDLDANTGGYNLQIAFSTGHLAGQLKENPTV
ncbi:BaiN/RdsA family NAD(P)/FAD-dependent oxidoreductase [Gallalistipes aquisgranensis]|uniref:NAD(P)/FAD-dependent oxidoreductase n=1 Tax=Gallalistipes aquisgranensis TaxID=2779358 RepID=UPI001CF8F0C8|nr:NAD(P)/FAD-dependent oxidoreductase [Gallalistipes aquisgranensis]